MPGTTVAASAPRRARRSRTADLALLVAAFVATAGVAFAVGRWTMQQSSAATPSLAGAGTFGPFAGAVVPAAAAGDGSRNSTIGADPVAAAAAGISADGPAVQASPRAVALTTGSTADGTSAAAGAAPGVPAASTAGGAPPVGASGSTPGGMAGPPGMAPGGLEGTVSDIGVGTLTLRRDDGTSLMLTTDEATTWVRESPIDATAIQAGDRVAVELPFGGLGRGQDSSEPSLVSQQVTLLPE